MLNRFAMHQNLRIHCIDKKSLYIVLNPFENTQFSINLNLFMQTIGRVNERTHSS